MHELTALTESCDLCRQELPEHSNCCLQCDSSSVPAVVQNAIPARKAVGTQQALVPVMPMWLQRRWVVITILLVAGPMGLPVLWLSHRFSRFTKIIVTTGLALLTVVFPIVFTWYWCEVAIRPLLDVFTR